MGLGLFWKERGPTSNEYLAGLKKSLGLAGPARKGIGHGGTLDPFAEGWLLVGWDEGSKFLGGLKGLCKTYIAEIFLGASTETLDDTVPLNYWGERLDIDEDKLKEFLKTKVTSFDQLPPLYSAKKVGGRASYDLIRQGIVADLKPAPVQIFEAEHLFLQRESPSLARWTVKVKVSAGCYIRCLARDWAMELFEQPGLLTQLARVGYGNFFEAHSKTPKIFKDIRELEAFFDVFHEGTFDQKFVPSRAEKGSLLLGAEGELKATWLTDSSRWRYFTENPLA